MDLYIKGVLPAATNRSTAKLMKTGQTTSYRTGDDGDLEAGRNTSFTVLAENNVFGNTNRFTDELGGQTYTNNIVIDWSTFDGSTVLGYRRTTGGGTWNSAIDASLLVSIGTFTTGWRLPNIREVYNLCDYGITTNTIINYSPFNIGVALLTSTTQGSNTALAIIVLGTGGINFQSKSTTSYYIPCRTFTVTGTTLS